jgi:hypothetical protein
MGRPGQRNCGAHTCERKSSVTSPLAKCLERRPALVGNWFPRQKMTSTGPAVSTTSEGSWQKGEGAG